MVRRKALKYEECHKMIDDIDHKLCVECMEWFPCNIDYYYAKNKNNSLDGYNTYCIKCTKEKRKKYIEKNKEEVLKKNYEYFLEHRETIYYQRNVWMEKNKDWMKEYQKNFKVENPDKTREYNQKRYSKKHKITLKQWDDCRLFFDYRCAYCDKTWEQNFKETGKDLHKEHVDDTGADDLSNCIPSCASCNCQKWKHEFKEWYNESNSNYTVERMGKIKLWLDCDHKKYIIST